MEETENREWLIEYTLLTTPASVYCYTGAMDMSSDKTYQSSLPLAEPSPSSAH